MKKLFSLILASTMTVGLMACGGANASNTTTSANKDTTSTVAGDSVDAKDNSTEEKSYRIIMSILLRQIRIG